VLKGWKVVEKFGHYMLMKTEGESGQAECGSAEGEGIGIVCGGHPAGMLSCVAAAETGGLHGSGQWRRSMEIVAHRRRPLDRLGLRTPPIPDGYLPGLTPGIDTELVVWLMEGPPVRCSGYQAGIRGYWTKCSSLLDLHQIQARV
jgi:hypothetical protein